MQVFNFLNWVEYKGHILKTFEYEYLKTLEKLGQASVSVLRMQLNLGRRTIQEIEQSLLNKGLIEITSKGRKISGYNDDVFNEILKRFKK